MQFDFKDKTVLVTGGTRGIGKSIAEKYEALGARLILTGQNRENLESERKAAQSDARRYLHLNFLEDGSFETFMAEVKADYDRIDILVNNAGINKVAETGATELADFENTLKVNVTGAMQLIQEIGNIMKQHQYGRIVNISSIFGVVARDKRVPYVTSKTALVGLTRVAAVDLAPYNILVNAVSPGFVATEMTKRMLGPVEKEALVSRVPLGRLAEPEEIAHVVLFLTSEYNSFITAQNIVADGGFVSV
jgi:3-oxoacyl-[acyl-carrier protein] reductase